MEARFITSLTRSWDGEAREDPKSSEYVTVSSSMNWAGRVAAVAGSYLSMKDRAESDCPPRSPSFEPVTVRARLDRKASKGWYATSATTRTVLMLSTTLRRRRTGMFRLGPGSGCSGDRGMGGDMCSALLCMLVLLREWYPLEPCSDLSTVWRVISSARWWAVSNSVRAAVRLAEIADMPAELHRLRRCASAVPESLWLAEEE
mmetsp:Transcript_11928/g.24212  ORF Transcript_11928/g.24212 Transcript_11928/m.24212 type:complete len:203 (-) Transcript_11928:403-1011(-)